MKVPKNQEIENYTDSLIEQNSDPPEQHKLDQSCSSYIGTRPMRYNTIPNRGSPHRLFARRKIQRFITKLKDTPTQPEEQKKSNGQDFNDHQRPPNSPKVGSIDLMYIPTEREIYTPPKRRAEFNMLNNEYMKLLSERTIPELTIDSHAARKIVSTMIRNQSKILENIHTKLMMSQTSEQAREKLKNIYNKILLAVSKNSSLLPDCRIHSEGDWSETNDDITSLIEKLVILCTLEANDRVIMIVDDGRFNRNCLRQTLSTVVSNWTAIEVEDGLIAMQIFKLLSVLGMQIIAVFSDANMAIMDGSELCRLVLLVDKDAQVYISTANYEEEIVLKSTIYPGVIAILRKTSDLTALNLK